MDSGPHNASRSGQKNQLERMILRSTMQTADQLRWTAESSQNGSEGCQNWGSVRGVVCRLHNSSQTADPSRKWPDHLRIFNGESAVQCADRKTKCELQTRRISVQYISKFWRTILRTAEAICGPFCDRRSNSNG